MELSRVHGSATPRLEELQETIEQRAGMLASMRVPGDRTREALLASVHATLRLDGSTVERDEVTAIADARDAGIGATAGVADEADDEHLRDAEVRGALDALTWTGPDLHVDPLGALRDLHVRLTRGLVDPTRAGRERELPQAVHDASVGRILYFTLDPEQVSDGLDQVARLLVDTDRPTVVMAGLVHLQLLRVHPFDAANGRLARVAARLVLRHAGLDPHGLVAFEPVLATDALGYHERVAAALRAHDPGPWLEYWAETLVQALRDAERGVGTSAVDADPRVTRVLATLPRELTIVDLRDALGTDLGDARAQAERLVDAGLLTAVRGSSGLRFVRTVD